MDQWQAHVSAGARPVFSAIDKCRTRALGYHLYTCNQGSCAHQKMQFHSCRNRHCPNCGGSRQHQWVEARMRELIPCKYFHVVFTVPHELNPAFMGNRKAMFGMLFDAAHYTLLKLGRDETFMGAAPGIISVLHTWGQNLSFHPHVHCIVSGGGIDHPTGRWKEAKKAKYNALFPIQVIEQIYRARFLHLFKRSVGKGEVCLPAGCQLQSLLDALYAKRWVVYAKQPFGGPQQVVEYLGRYTQKVAINNRRIKHIDAHNRVTFVYKDYAQGGVKRTMRLEGEEFLRRFEQHILPRGFCKIRSCGLYANHNRKTRVAEVLRQLKLPPHPEPVHTPWHITYFERRGVDPLKCPCCAEGRLQLAAVVRAPGGKLNPEVRRE